MELGREEPARGVGSTQLLPVASACARWSSVGLGRLGDRAGTQCAHGAGSGVSIHLLPSVITREASRGSAHPAHRPRMSVARKKHVVICGARVGIRAGHHRHLPLHLTLSALGPGARPHPETTGKVPPHFRPRRQAQTQEALAEGEKGKVTGDTEALTPPRSGGAKAGLRHRARKPVREHLAPPGWARPQEARAAWSHAARWAGLGEKLGPAFHPRALGPEGWGGSCKTRGISQAPSVCPVLFGQQEKDLYL